eukprot:TRINITY_DN11887_c0_g1_i1.p1 TRINITY_DN11887_c0_g1~~TRINITY_DN11887_c0_g1_i1.p1  ORF type:complete len:203 (+),score=26.06 TRINITY_DN11887_c0_g1_i1:21-629(+)
MKRTIFYLCIICITSSLVKTQTNPNLKPFPTAFNSTLVKVDEYQNIQWTKLYYDFNFPASRFDFYNGYIDANGKWDLNCSILFADDLTVWFIFPEAQTCNLRSKDLITFSPDWMNKIGAYYAGTSMFRGIQSTMWDMKDPDDPQHIMRYYAAADNGYPLRSPNQINDPGSTDFFDVMVGPQNKELFKVPEYCYTNPTTWGCG